MRNTLNRLVDKSNFALRNFSHGARTLAAVRRMASIASCSGEAKGRVCRICLAKVLDTAEDFICLNNYCQAELRPARATRGGLRRHRHASWRDLIAVPCGRSSLETGSISKASLRVSSDRRETFAILARTP